MSGETTRPPGADDADLPTIRLFDGRHPPSIADPDQPTAGLHRFACSLSQGEKIGAANDIASFLIESLVWNVPDSYFGADTYTDMIKNVLAHTASDTSEQSRCHEWGEVNELKYLFRAGQPWTRDQANSFLIAAWTYLGF